MLRAEVTRKRGDRFDAEVTNLAVGSLFLRTNRSLAFREELCLRVLGVELIGEVVHVFEGPEGGVGVVFPVTPEAEAVIKSATRAGAPPGPSAEPTPKATPKEGPSGSRAPPPAGASMSTEMSSSALDTASLDALRSESTDETSLAIADDVLTGDIVAAPTTDIPILHTGTGVTDAATGRSPQPTTCGIFVGSLSSAREIVVDDPLEAMAIALMLRSGRSIWVRNGAVSGEVELRWGGHTIGLATTHDLEGPAALRLVERSAVDALLREVEPSVAARLSKEPLRDDIPALGSDGHTIRFTDRVQYEKQWKTNLAHGALVVRSPSLDGQDRRLRIEAPGLVDPVEVMARVAFCDRGLVGFEVLDFSAVRSTLEGATQSATPWQELTPWRDLTPVIPTTASSPKKVFRFRGPLSPAPGVRAIMDFPKSSPSDLDGCGGWFLRVIDFLFRAGAECLVRFSDGARTLTLWIMEGRLVFSTRTPPSDEDFLGRILQRDFKVRHVLVEEGMRQAKEAGQPLGDALVSAGMITQQVLNRALRQQMVDRVLDLRTWTTGEIDVSAWKNPKLSGRLIAVAGDGLVTGVLREYVRHLSVDELETELTPYMNRIVRADASKLDARLGLKPKELRVFQRASSSETTLQQLGTAAGVGATDAMRLSVLGASMGIVDFGVHPDRPVSARAEHIGKKLEEELAQANAGTHFEVLGVHWTASESEIEGGYRERVGRLRPLSQSSDTQVATLAKQLMGRVTEARLTLMDRRTRRLYREQRWPPSERRTAADHLAEHAQLLILRGDARGAESLVNTAEELHVTERTRQVRELLLKR